MSIQHYYSQTIADGTATSVVRPSDWNSAHKQVLNMAGNTAGTSQITGSDIIWAGGNNVTLSANGSTVSVIGPTQTVQTQASGNIVGSGFTSITIGGAVVAATQNSAGLLMAVPNYLTTYANDLTSGRAGTGFTSTSTAGSNIVATVGTDGVSMGVPNYLTTAQPVGAYLTTAAQSDHSHGNPTLALTNLSGTTASASNGFTISLSAANPGGGAGDGYNIIGVNGGATQLSTTYQLSNANNVTFGLNAGTITASASYAAQTVQTQASGNIAGSGYTSTTQAGTSIGATLNSNGLSLAQPAFLTTAQPVGAYLTTARASNDAIGLNTALTANGVSVTANSSGLSINVPAFLTTAAQSNHSHNFATTTTNGAVIVVGTTNSAGATIGVPSFLTTAAATDITSGRAGTGTTYAGTNVNATLNMGTNGLALSLSAAGGGTINQTGPNIAVAGSTVTSGDVYFSNSPTVTFGMAGSTITASAAGGAGVTLSNYVPFPAVGNNTSWSMPGANSLYLQHMYVPANVTMSNIELYARGTYASSTNSMGAYQTITYGLYSQDTGTNSTRMNLMSSSTAQWSATFNSSTSCGFTFAAGGSTLQSATNNSSVFVGLSGAFHLYLPFAAALSPNVKYAVGYLVSSTTSVGTQAPHISGFYQMTVLTSNMGRLKANTWEAASSTVIGDYDQGVYGTTTGAFPTSYATSNLGIAPNRNKLFVQFEV